MPNTQPKLQDILLGRYDPQIAERIKTQELDVDIKQFQYRWAVMLDPYYFVKYMLQYDKLIPIPHREMCHEMRYDKYLRILRLRPRRIFKTTIYDIAKMIDLLIVNPNLNMLIAMNSATNARGVLSEIKGQFEKNERFRYVYGDWAIGAPRWQSESIVINRATRHVKEGTIDAIGIDTTIASKHYDMIFMSDIVDQEDRDSSAKRRDSMLFCKDVIDLVKDETSPIWQDGTFWHFDDYYHYVIEELNSELISKGEEPYHVVIKPVRYRKELGDPSRLEGQLRHPEFFSEKVLNRILAEKGMTSYSPQYDLKCLSDKTQIFKKENTHYFDMRGIIRDKCTVYGYHDPALGESEKACFAPIVTCYIPDYSDPDNGISKGDILMVDMHVYRLTPSEGKVVMAKKHRDYNYSSMGCEANGFQKLYALDSCKVELKPGKWVYVPIDPIVNTKSKTLRIESFEPHYTNGTVKFRKDWQTAPNNYREGLSQLWNYPLDDYRDVPDACAGLMQVVQSQNLYMA